MLTQRGLDQLIAEGCSIPRAVPSRKWPGTASLEVAHIWLRKGEWKSNFILDEKNVSGISPFLTIPSKASGTPYRLKANESKSFIGSYVLGMGFVMTPEEAHVLIAKNPKNKDVLFPYLNGEDLNSRPDQSPSRWVINFFDWPLNREGKGKWHGSDEEEQKEWLRKGIVPSDYPDPVAADYPDCLDIVVEKIKPERTRKNEKGEFALRYPLYLRWWIYGDKRPALYTTIAGMERVLAIAETTKYCVFSLCVTGIVFSHMTKIITFGNEAFFSLLNSTIHECWVREYCSTLENRLKYNPSDCFETFPFPKNVDSLNEIGERYHVKRQSIMLSHQEGLTKTYNRFHNSNETSADITKLRELHVEIDKAVAEAYGWTDLDLGHGFHETKQGMRFTICEEARREVLDRLLELNHQRYAAEVAAGLHDKGKDKKKGTSGKGKKKIGEAPEQASLF